MYILIAGHDSKILHLLVLLNYLSACFVMIGRWHLKMPSDTKLSALLLSLSLSGSEILFNSQ